MKKSIRLGELSQKLGARLYGDPDQIIFAISDLSQASENEISFLSDSKYEQYLDKTRASAVLVDEKTFKKYNTHVSFSLVVVTNTYLAYAKTAQLIDTTPELNEGIHSSAVIAKSARVSPTARIAENVVIGENARIENNVQIGANSFVGEDCVIGEDSRLWSNVTLYHAIKMGSGCIIHSGTVIGSDGFGFAQESSKWIKIPQLGDVIIGNDVEIGANCCIDRGALGATQIGHGVKIDNMVHLAHNVVIGDDCAMAGCVAIAGSSEIGARTTLAGGVGILGHLKIAEGSHFTARTLVNRSNENAGIFSGGTGMMENKAWRKNVVRFRQLDDMSKKIRQLEKSYQSIKDELLKQKGHSK